MVLGEGNEQNGIFMRILVYCRYESKVVCYNIRMSIVLKIYVYFSVACGELHTTEYTQCYLRKLCTVRQYARINVPLRSCSQRNYEARHLRGPGIRETSTCFSDECKAVGANVFDYYRAAR